MSTGAVVPLKDIELVVLDFDGVLTDNAVYVWQDGTEGVRCHRGDGLGVAMLQAAGVPVLVLSTETNPVVSARAEKMRVECHQGIVDKGAALAVLLAQRAARPARVAYVGNDVNDLGALALVGLPVAVADSHPDVLAVARLVLSKPGGRGAVRELCDLILVALRVPA